MELAQILAELPNDYLYAAEQDLWVRQEGTRGSCGGQSFRDSSRAIYVVLSPPLRDPGHA